MEIQGRYQDGMIVPANHLSLPNGTEVTIVVPEQSPKNRTIMTDEERSRLLAALVEIDAVPNENPGDTFCGRDHDQVLYGRP